MQNFEDALIYMAIYEMIQVSIVSTYFDKLVTIASSHNM